MCTPEDAYRCFMRTEMDFLVLGDYCLDKKDQPALPETDDWRTKLRYCQELWISDRRDQAASFRSSSLLRSF